MENYMPGYIYYQCDNCCNHWKYETKDCHSLYSQYCWKCYEDGFISDIEEHPEQITDKEII